MPKKNPFHPLAKIPEVYETCGQKIDSNSSESLLHHQKARHLPDAGKKRSWR